MRDKASYFRQPLLTCLELLDGGGVHTTIAALSRFFAAMMLYPEVQARAQKEIDAVTGGERLPTLNE